MQKITKGAIAAGAAALLLVGGGGTFMSWNDTEGVQAQAINSGSLSLEPVSTTWTLNGNDVTDINTAEIVPGDILVFSQVATYATIGEGVNASLSMNPGSIAPAVPEDLEDEALKAVLDQETDLNIVEMTAVDGVYTIGGDDNGTVTAVATITFPQGTEGDNSTQLGNVTFEDMSISFDQVTDPSEVAE